MKEYNYQKLAPTALRAKGGSTLHFYPQNQSQKKHQHLGNRTENGNAHWPLWATNVNSSQLLSMSEHQLKIQHLKICVGIHTICALVYYTH